MTTIANIAQRVLNENGYTTSDISLINLEYKIDDAIDYVNLHTGLSIADLAESAGSKSITATDGQILIVKWLSNLFISALKDKGANVGISSLSLNYVLSANERITKMVLAEVERLKEPPIVIGKDTTGLDSE